MIFPALITALALVVYLVFTFNVIRARGRYSVKAPATSGNLEFEKRLRVQLNTLEQLVPFIPALWLCSKFWPYSADMFGIVWDGPRLASLVGLIWIVSRLLFSHTYYNDPEKRYVGMAATFLSTVLLTLGATAGILVHFYQ